MPPDEPIGEAVGQAIIDSSAAGVILQILRELLKPPEKVTQPTKPFVAPVNKARETFAGGYAAFSDWGVPWWLAMPAALALALVVLVGAVLGAVLLYLLDTVGVDVVEAVVEFIDEARKELDTSVARISVIVLNELLGTEFRVEDMPTGEGIEAHIDRAERIGGLFLKQLMGELKDRGDLTVEDGAVAASRFLGLVINFGTATAFINLLGEFGSFGFIEGFRELGVQVARNLGLGRLTRLVLRPVIATLIDKPLQWGLNLQFHPEQLPLAQLVNPFTGAVMSEEIIFQDMELLGFSREKIEALIKLHQRRLNDTDVDILVRWGAWSREEGIRYIRNLGFPEEIAETVLNVIDLRRADQRVRDLVGVLESRVADGHLTVAEMEVVIDKLPLAEAEKSIISTIASYKVKTSHLHLTLGEMQTAFEQALVDLSEFEAYLVKRGFDENDRAIVVQLTLLKLAALVDKTKAKASRQQSAAARQTAIAARAPKAAPAKLPPPIQ